MITETLLNSLKSLFSSLGAKTSDSNYAVGLFDKTSGEPKGLMGISNLASVLGVNVPVVVSGSSDANTLVNDKSLVFGVCIGSNTPVSQVWWFIISLNLSSTVALQLAFQKTTSNPQLYMRTLRDGEWDTWKTITTTV